jgi:hypothetical protein
MRFLGAFGPKSQNSRFHDNHPSQWADAFERLEPLALPPAADLEKYLGAEVTSAELCIGELIALHRPKAARVNIHDDLKFAFADRAFCGPLPADQFFFKLVAKATEYYKLKHGKKSRRVYLRGSLIKLPVEVGVVKCPKAGPLARDIGAEYLLHARQQYVPRALPRASKPHSAVCLSSGNAGGETA